VREREHLEDSDVDGGILLKWIFRSGVWGMNWLDLAEDRKRWRAVVSAVP